MVIFSVGIIISGGKTVSLVGLLQELVMQQRNLYQLKTAVSHISYWLI